MKKYILFLFGAFCLNVNSQSVLYTEDFNASFANGITTTFEWVIDDLVLPQSANYSGASASYYIAASNGGNGLETMVLNDNISTLAFNNITVSWGAYKDVNFPGPTTGTVTFEWSTDGVTWNPVSFNDVQNNQTWALVGPVSLPVGASGANNLQLRWSYTAGNLNEFYAIDDIVISGDIFQYFSKSTGNLDVLSTWGTNIDGTGIQPTNFTSNGITYNIVNNTAPTLGSPWIVSGSSSSVIVGNGTISTNFTIPSSIPFTGSISVSNNGTLTIQDNSAPIPNFITLSNGSTVDYAANGSQNITSTTYYNLLISGSGSKTYTNNVTVNNLLSINSGSLTMATNSFRNLILNGNYNQVGSLVGNPSRLSINGTGNFGTLTFAAGSQSIGAFSINRGSSGSILLGSDLFVSGQLVFTNGSLNLNGNYLRLNNSVTLPVNSTLGNFIGSNNSGLTFMGGGTITNNLLLDQSSTSNRTLKTLNLRRSTTLNLGCPLIITDSLGVNAGTFNSNNNNIRLTATSTLSARLARINGTFNGNNVTVETFAPGGTTDWTNLGVSGITNQTFQNWYGQIPMAIEGSTTGVTSAGGYYFESVQGWNESTSYGYDTTITVTSSITPGRGYWVFLGTGLTTSNDMNWNVTGTPVMGNVTIPLTFSSPTPSVEGWHLISNPYASPINWDRVLLDNAAAVSASLVAIYIYNPDLGSTTSYVSGVSTPNPSSPPVFDVANGIIPKGQAFYVQVTNGTSVTFNENHKSSGNTGNNPLLKTSNTSNNFGDIIRLNIDGGGYHDDAVIRFHSNASPYFDGNLDAHKMYSSPGYAGYPGQWSLRTAIATQSNNEDYSINSIPYAQTQNAVMPVVARVYQSGTHTISATELQNLPPGTCVDLKDLYTNTVYDLTSGPCIVNMSDTTFYPRFELTVCANVATSVKNNFVKNAPAIAISKDAIGVYSDFNFTEQTDAKITITNILGQKIVADKKVSVKNERVYIDANLNDNIIFVTVETSTERITRKFLNLK